VNPCLGSSGRRLDRGAANRGVYVVTLLVFSLLFVPESPTTSSGDGDLQHGP